MKLKAEFCEQKRQKKYRRPSTQKLVLVGLIDFSFLLQSIPRMLSSTTQIKRHCDGHNTEEASSREQKSLDLYIYLALCEE